MEKAWDGRFDKATDKYFEKISHSITYDWRLYIADIFASSIYAKALQKIENNISSKSHYSKLLNLNKNYKNHEYHNSLTFNLINNYFIKFNKCLIGKKRSFQLSGKT